MTESIFTPDQGEAVPASQEASTEAKQETTPAAPSIPTELQEFVGEGKKFKSVADYVSGYKNSQEFIDTLKGETATMREELTKRKTAEELLLDMRTSSTEQQKPTSQGVEVNEAVLSEMVEKKFAQVTQAKTHEENARLVVSSLGNTFGDKSQEVFNKIAQENDMTPQEFEKLAATKPNMVLKLCGASAKATHSTSLQSDVNSQALKPKPQEEHSLKLPPYPTSKDLARVWEVSRANAYKKYNITE